VEPELVGPLEKEIELFDVTPPEERPLPPEEKAYAGIPGTAVSMVMLVADVEAESTPLSTCLAVTAQTPSESAGIVQLPVGPVATNVQV
jgi:hypothetical protein